MSDHVSSDKQRLLELLSDRALFGLSSEEEQELELLREAHPDVDASEMDHIVGLLEASSPAADQPSMPTSLKDAILKTSMGGPTASGEPRQSGVLSSSVPASKSTSGQFMLIVALLATAASLLMAFSTALWRPTQTPPTLSVVQQKANLEAEASDLVRVDWEATGAAPITGDVVWSNAKQSGFMTFTGLPVNNPREEQYQLWIFDDAQDARYPIDGGVFDVVGNSATIAIDAKIRVVKPTMFAITIEKPGGVVVSDRSRLPVIAKL